HPLPLLFFDHPPSDEIYSLSLHDALPIYLRPSLDGSTFLHVALGRVKRLGAEAAAHPTTHLIFHWDEGVFPNVEVERHLEEVTRSEEHTSELQSRENLVCRLLLETKNESH